ncbi:MAG: hypothetical protein NWE95_04165 [Candidatus Bathyarchaeota archaeon]|nr:hypothetical protein [Candidatus Bathyarchaeota archaeon]
MKILLAFCFAILTAYPLLLIEQAEGNPWTASPEWRVSSPQNNATYNRTYVNLDLRVISENNNNYYYSIDGSPEIPIRVRDGDLKPDPNLFEFKKVLNGLAEGKHTLILYHDIWFYHEYILNSGQTITFYIDTTAPKISNLSINSTGTGDWLLNFTIDENASWVGYSLDNQANITINGDAVLRDLSFGVHNVTVYANDTVGNLGASDTLTFTVDEPEVIQHDTVDSADLFPIVAIVSIATVATVSIGLRVYFTKIRRKLEL